MHFHRATDTRKARPAWLNYYPKAKTLKPSFPKEWNSSHSHLLSGEHACLRTFFGRVLVWCLVALGLTCLAAWMTRDAGAPMQKAILRDVRVVV